MKKYCVIGNPVGHSRSPQLFERFVTEKGLCYGKDAVYERHEITNRDELETFVEEMRRGLWDGCNVTMPWKTDMVSFMDEISETARITQAVNTVSSKRGRLYGDSTDGRGMLNAIAGCTGKDRIGTLIMLGCGGAARSILAESILRKTGKITMVCRGVNESETPLNLGLTLEMLGRIKTKNTEIVFIDSADSEAIQAAVDESEVLINSTPLGMLDGNGNETRLPLPESITLRKLLLVADCIYNPDETLLLKKAMETECRIVKGISMLEEQARCGVDILLGRY